MIEIVRHYALVIAIAVPIVAVLAASEIAQGVAILSSVGLLWLTGGRIVSEALRLVLWCLYGPLLAPKVHTESDELLVKVNLDLELAYIADLEQYAELQKIDMSKRYKTVDLADYVEPTINAELETPF